MSISKLNNVCDYIICSLNEAGEKPNLLKLQKLLYYSQAWCFALNHKPFFDAKFQAWVHGPVNREIYDRFAGDKFLYSRLEQKDTRAGFTSEWLSADDRAHVDSVLEVYAEYSGTQLEELTHREEPWQDARKGLSDSQRCETVISESLMESHYAKLLD